MSGTKLGGEKAAMKNKEKYGEDFYKRIGAKGGAKSHPETRPFFVDPEKAREAGKKGGLKSRRGPAKNPRKKTVAEKVEPQVEKKGLLKWFSGRKDK